MEKDVRYQWIENRLVNAFEPKRDALHQLTQNDENRFDRFRSRRKTRRYRNFFCFRCFSLSFEQFFENEDITHLYLFYQPTTSTFLATNSIPNDWNSYQRILLFIKSNLTNKLTKENLGSNFS